jgi:hypothetical protein
MIAVVLPAALLIGLVFWMASDEGRPFTSSSGTVYLLRGTTEITACRKSPKGTVAIVRYEDSPAGRFLVKRLLPEGIAVADNVFDQAMRDLQISVVQVRG